MKVKLEICQPEEAKNKFYSYPAYKNFGVFEKSRKLEGNYCCFEKKTGFTKRTYGL